jgi:hypothetical protein
LAAALAAAASGAIADATLVSAGAALPPYVGRRMLAPWDVLNVKTLNVEK